MMPEYLLLFHNEKADLFELESDEPALANASFLKTLGFDCHGDNYLCFKLKNNKRLTIENLGGKAKHPIYDKNNYAPYFTTLHKIIK